MTTRRRQLLAIAVAGFAALVVYAAMPTGKVNGASRNAELLRANPILRIDVPKTIEEGQGFPRLDAPGPGYQQQQGRAQLDF